jgi:hypothetical protein
MAVENTLAYYYVATTMAVKTVLYRLQVSHCSVAERAPDFVIVKGFKSGSHE